MHAVSIVRLRSWHRGGAGGFGKGAGGSKDNIRLLSPTGADGPLNRVASRLIACPKLTRLIAWPKLAKAEALGTLKHR